MTTLRFLLIAALILLSFVKNGYCQDIYVAKTHEVILSGTSNVHDWTAKVIDLTGTVQYSDKGFNEATISVKANTLKSSKGSIMDSKMQDALNTGKYPVITFKLVSAKILKETNFLKDILTTGELTISGTTKKVILTTKGKLLQNGNIETYGNFDIFMTDFGIEPPTALLGALTTNNKVSVSYKIIFQKK